VGGQVAEIGVGMSAADLVRHARGELTACIPGLKLDGVEWGAYRVDRAEPDVGGRRPASVHAAREGAVITAWPTKLALAPRLADAVCELLGPAPRGAGPDPIEALRDWPRPRVADPPWDEESLWNVER
jgi:hypothetical protein